MVVPEPIKAASIVASGFIFDFCQAVEVIRFGYVQWIFCGGEREKVKEVVPTLNTP